MEANQEEKASKMLDILDWAYEKALTGLPGAGSAIELAQDYEKESGTLEEKVNSLIRWQISKTATTGFLTGLGGLITLPVAIPADIASALYVQLRMIAAIAHLGGYDIKDDKVKSLIYACLVGESVKDILKDVGIQIGVKVGKNLLKSLPGKVLTNINKTVGIRLVTKFGTKGVVNAVKILPVVGGVIGGSINAISTNTVGNIARNTFIKTNTESPTADQFMDVMEEIDDTPNIELLKFYSYLNIIKVDGNKRNEEFELFDNLISNSFLDDNLRMELIQKLHSKETDKVDYSQFKDYPEQSIQLLMNLILIAKCDNDLHIAEKMFIKNIAKQLGYSAEDIESLINETT